MIIDDHQIIRDAIYDVLQNDPDINVVGSYDSIEAFRADVRKSAVDVLIVDYLLPGSSGVDHAREIMAQRYARATVLLTQFVRYPIIQQAAKAGVKCLVAKERAVSNLRSAIEAAYHHAHYLCPVFLSEVFAALAATTSSAPVDNVLTSRERVVLKHLVSGSSRRQIADELYISIATVTTHRRRIMTKLGAHSTADLVQAAMRLGVL